MGVKRNETQSNDLNDLKQKMRAGSIYSNQELILSHLEKGKEIHTAKTYACGLINELEEYNKGTITLGQFESFFRGSSWLVQKDPGAPAQNFENKNRHGSFISDDIISNFSSNKVISLQCEHPIDRNDIHNKIKNTLCDFLKTQRRKILPRARPGEIAAVTFSLYAFKDDCVINTQQRGKSGIERYEKHSVQMKTANGSFVSLESGEFYQKILLPSQTIIDVCIEGLFIPFLEGDINFQQIVDIFKGNFDNTENIDVNLKKKLYDAWCALAKARSINRNDFPSPMLITPNFYYKQDFKWQKQNTI